MFKNLIGNIWQQIIAICSEYAPAVINCDSLTMKLILVAIPFATGILSIIYVILKILCSKIRKNSNTINLSGSGTTNKIIQKGKSNAIITSDKQKINSIYQKEE
jgi:hypothetical protein